MIKFLLISIISLFAFAVSNTPLFSIGDSTYYESDMFDFYGMSSWNRSSVEQRNKMINDFIVREGAFWSSKADRLDMTASFKEKSYNKKRQLLVNFLYQYEISKMVMDSSRFELGKVNLKKDLLVHHILFGYDGSALRAPVGRSKEEAYFLCSSVLDTITFQDFQSVAKAYSNDGSVNKNLGRLGWVSWGSTVPAFEEQIFEENVGSFVGPIETEFGFHIAYIEDQRNSSLSYLGEQELLDAALLKSASRDMDYLKKQSAKYDSIVLTSGSLVFNDSLINVVYNSINKSVVDKSINKNDIVAVLKSNHVPGVFCVFNNNSLGLDWFINKLSFYNPSSRPNIKDIESFYTIFKTLILQDEAYEKGLLLGYDQKPGFKKQLMSFEKDLLYTSYFKSVVNNVSLPDSSKVRAYYSENKDKKYKTPLSLKLEQLNVIEYGLADSLLNLYIMGESFSSIVERFSISYNSSSKGFIGPVESNYKRGVLKNLFINNPKEGAVSDIIANPDSSFSIYKVSNVFPEQYIPLEKTYSRISSILHRNLQEEAKEKAIQNFYTNFNIIKNDSIN